MTAPITVDPVALAGMGAAVATDGVTVATAVHTLSTALSGAGALFGYDSAGLLFGQSYTQAGRSLLEAAGSAVNACRKVGFGVQMSAFNYGRANAASTVGGGETPVPQPSAPGAFTAPSMPPPMGSGIAAPLLWTVVESLVGDVWPDGNPAEMRAAAAAWRSFGASIGTTAEPVTAVSAALAGQQIPEAGHMGDAAAQISSGLADIAAQAQELASHVEAFATNVEATQNAIRGLLHQLSISGVLDALGDIFSGENPWQKVQEVADEIKTVLGNMKRQADASRTLFSQSMNALDSATTSLQSWATKEFVEVFGEDVGTALSQDFKALTGLPAGGLKFLGVTAEGLQGLDPMRFAYDPQGAVDTWKSLADSTAMLTNPALLAEKVISDPQGSLDAAKAMVDWEDVEKGDPFRALGYNAAQVGTMFLPGAGEAGPAASAASAEARVAGAEARAAGAGTRDAAAAAGGRAASTTEGISTKAGEIGSKLDGIKVPEAQPGSSVVGKAPVEVPRADAPMQNRGAPGSELPTAHDAPSASEPNSQAPQQHEPFGPPHGPDHPNNPPHTDLYDPPPNHGVIGEQLPDLSAINAEYRLPEGLIDPRRFEEWTHRVSEAYPQITPDGVAAIYHYSTENYEAINPYLRNMEPLTDNQVMVLDAKSIADMTDAQRATLEARILHIDEGLSSLPPYRADPSDATSTTWRGLHAPDDLLANMQPGSIFGDPGFLSTSLDPQVAELFAMRAGEGTTPSVITVQGHNGVDIAQLSQYVDESEILFPRSSQFEVLSTEMGSDGILRITLRQVGP
ncbi:hypothetical protein EUA04_11535 [Mycolicibacterium obuense]|uniref:Uncharacterized protein n=1 Tax=Mycolicibacterium obuense TaxID=1807 RepID=A0A4R5XC63_9MYCO|nr:ADP-ribosyltransferase [Mycolicibacterium obuense]TDL10512.1 hypothetical protein EUA04_11535 [Mycolicibacterium obuense]